MTIADADVDLGDVRAVLLPDGWHLAAIGSFEPAARLRPRGSSAPREGDQEYSFIDVSASEPVRLIVPATSVLALKLAYGSRS